MIRVLLTLLALLTGAAAPCAVAQPRADRPSAIGAALAPVPGDNTSVAPMRCKTCGTDAQRESPLIGMARHAAAPLVATVLPGIDRARE